MSIEEGGRNKPSSGSPPGAGEKDAAATAAAANDAAAPTADGKADASAANGNSNGSRSGSGSVSGSGSHGHGSNDSRPTCAAAGCDRQARTDSKYCCESCGVRTAEAEMAEAIRHSLEMRGGLDRGRRVRETRELKARKHQARRKRAIFDDLW